MLIHRFIPHDRLAGRSLPSSVLALALLLTFAITIPKHAKLIALKDLLDIALVYPAIVVLAMRSNPPSLESKLLIWAGALSYPMYIVHYPFFIWLAAALHSIASPLESHPYVCICIAIVSSGAFAMATYHAYDIPVRAWLTGIVKPARGSSRL